MSAGALTAQGDRLDGVARDLRRACIHEYAHLAIARRFGACGFVTIVPIVPRTPDEERFAGRFQMLGELADDEWRIVALAGTVGECLDGDPCADALEIARRLDDGTLALPDVDAQLARGYTAEDVVRCVALVRAEWSTIRREAEARATAAR
jgi:hypothetical protein